MNIKKNYTTYIEENTSWDFFPNIDQIKKVGDIPKYLIVVEFKSRLNESIIKWNYLTKIDKKQSIIEIIYLFPFFSDIISITVEEYEKIKKENENE